MSNGKPLQLANLSVLVVEDEPLVAMALADELECAQARVIGPVASVAQALEILQKQTPDAAILDVDLSGVSVGPAADWLSKRGIPFIFATGLDRISLTGRLADIPVCAKPVPAAEVISLLAQTVHDNRAAEMQTLSRKSATSSICQPARKSDWAPPWPTSADHEFTRPKEAGTEPAPPT